jgi:hypothetical protein
LLSTLFVRTARALLRPSSLESGGVGINDSKDRRISSDLSQISTKLEHGPFAHKSHVRPPRCDNWVPPKDMRLHGAARRRSRAAPRHLRRHGRHADALSPAPQQQPNHELFPPRGKSLPLPLSPTHTTSFRGATLKLRGGAPHKESQPTSEITPPPTIALNSRTRPRPPTHQAHCVPTHTSALFAF